VIERYRLGELPAKDAARIDRQLGNDIELRARVAALNASDEALREDVERIVSGLGRRLVAGPVRRTAWAAWLVAAAAATLVAVVARTNAPAPATSADDRVKGNPSMGVPAIAVYRRTKDGSERLPDGSVAHAGDVIRLGYRAAGRPFGIIVSIDGVGNVTRHLPTTGDRAVRLENSAMVLLDQAYELDDAPQWERFYLVTGETAFDVGPVLQAMQTGGTPPQGLDQSIFTLRKEALQ
jgi:hypothetical protein